MKSQRQRVIPLAACMCLSLPGFAQQADKQDLQKNALQQQIDHAISQFENTPRKQWAYQVKNYENEEGEISSSLESYDPSRTSGKPWLLLSINGETPNKKQIKKFDKRKKQASEAAEKEEQSIRFRLRDLIVIDSLQLVSQNNYSLQASFNVELERLGSSASKKLKGVLTYDKDNEYIEKIEINNTDSFSPIFSADIKEFTLTMNFDKLNGAVLPEKYEMNMKGSFAFFTEIDEVSQSTFSDYRFVGE